MTIVKSHSFSTSVVSSQEEHFLKRNSALAPLCLSSSLARLKEGPNALAPGVPGTEVSRDACL